MEEVGLSERESVPGIRYIYYKVLWQVVPNMSEEQQRPIEQRMWKQKKEESLGSWRLCNLFSKNR